MTRPSKSESIELERLETAAGSLYQAIEAAEVLSLRFRQIRRRAPALRDLIGAGIEALTAMTVAMSTAYELLTAVLDEKQAQRHWKHFQSVKGDDGE
jgi:hypothetical protein